MTNEEMDAVIQKIVKGTRSERIQALAGLSVEQREQVMARMRQLGDEADEKARQMIREAASNPRLQELYAQDQAKKKQKKQI